MSLINQVLRDLDRRARPAAALPGAVQAVAAVAVVPWHRQAAAAAAVLGLLALGSVLRPGVGASGAPFGVAEAPPPAPADVGGSATGLRLASAASADVTASGSAAWSLTSSSLRLAASAAGVADPQRMVSTADADAPQAGAAAPRQPVGPRRIGLRLDWAGAGGDSAMASAAAGFAPAAAVTEIAAVGIPPAVPVVPPPPPPIGPVRIEKRETAAGPLERAEAAYRLGVDAQQRGDDAAAASEYAAALREDGALAAARVGLAGVRLAQGRPADAEEVLRAGLATSPRQAALAMPLARLLAARGELTAAIGVLQAGLSGAAAGNADYRACFGAVLQRAGQHREAIEQFEAALRLAPASGVWWMGLAISLAADSRADAARSAFKHALAAGGLSPELAQFVEQRLRQLL